MDTKIILNSVISQASKGVKFLSCDLKDFFLATPMKESEYMKIPYKYFPSDIRHKYNLHSILHTDGYIYCKINKGMYGLKQAAVLAYNKLSTHLSDGGYHPIIGSMGMWKHKVKKINFCLCCLICQFSICLSITWSILRSTDILNFIKYFEQANIEFLYFAQGLLMRRSF